MARRSEHTHEEIKEMILVAAETIVINDGFKALKVRQIAMEMGYTVGSLYMVFKNRDDLITHLKVRTLKALQFELEKGINNDLDENQKIIAISKIYINFAKENFNRWRMIFEPCPNTDTLSANWYQQKMLNTFQGLEFLFKQLAPQSNLQQQQQAARALWGGINGILLTDHLNSDTESRVLVLVKNFIKGWCLQQGSD